MRLPRLSTTHAALLIAFACVIGLVLFVLDDQSDEQRDQKEEVDTGYIGCLRFNDTRLLFRDIILDAYGTASGATFDVTALPQYDRLEDPAMKELLVLLTSAPSSSTPTERRDRSYNRTGTRVCETEYPDHSAGITLETAVTVPPPPLEAP